MTNTNDPSKVPTNPTGLRRPMSRRSILQLLAYGSAAGAVGGVAAACTPNDPRSGLLPSAAVDSLRATTSPGAVGAAAPRSGAAPILVLIEQGGGLDALSVLAPHDVGAYVEGRGAVAHKASELVFTDAFGERGLHPGLAPLADRGLGIVEGVGLEKAFGSHFESARHWYRGDRRGDGSDQSGILGRIGDELDTGQPVVGLTASNGSPIMASAKAGMQSLPSTDSFDWMLGAEGPDRIIVDQMAALAASSSAGPTGLGSARDGLRSMGRFQSIVAELVEPSAGYPEAAGARDLGDRLALVSRLIRSDIGIRVFHVPHGGYDTHTSHRFAPPNDWQPDHDMLLSDFGASVARFIDDMAESGFGDRVVVATFSEFGRRVQANHSGTDHGWATSMLVAGANVVPGLHGSDPGFDRLVGGNQRPTMLIDEYFGALTEGWLGVPMSSVLPRFDARPLEGLFR